MPQTTDRPAFSSSALADLPRPDFCDVHVVPLPPGAPTGPATWARVMFGGRGTPGWVRAALVARQALVPLLGIPRAPSTVFDVRAVAGGEALISFDDTHLDFRVAVGVDVEQQLVRVTSTVRVKNRRGRLYFRPVAIGHGAVVEAMLRRTARLVAGTGPGGPGVVPAAGGPGPVFRSLVFEDLPRPDFCDVHVVPLPSGAPADPGLWAAAVFSDAVLPRWLRAALTVRRAVQGSAAGPEEPLSVREVVGEEALLVFAGSDVRIGVAVDPVQEHVRVTTAVVFARRRSFLPVVLVHGPTLEGMLRRAARNLS